MVGLYANTLCKTSSKLACDKKLICTSNGGKKMTLMLYKILKNNSKVITAAIPSLMRHLPIFNLVNTCKTGMPINANTNEIIKYTTTFVNKYTNKAITNKVIIGRLYFLIFIVVKNKMRYFLSCLFLK